MKFRHSTLRVNDLDVSINFYREIVGLEVVRRFSAGPGFEIVFMGGGETKIELICDKSQGKVDAGTDISWGFEVDDADAFMVELKSKGIAIHSGPFAPNPHVKYFYVLDPDGMKLQFISEK
jgi:Lactoylglutathione lyase and related lyases